MGLPAQVQDAQLSFSFRETMNKNLLSQLGANITSNNSMELAYSCALTRDMSSSKSWFSQTIASHEGFLIHSLSSQSRYSAPFLPQAMLPSNAADIPLLSDSQENSYRK